LHLFLGHSDRDRIAGLLRGLHDQADAQRG